MDENINIFISGRKYPLKVPFGEEELLRKAAKAVEDECRAVKSTMAVRDEQDVLAMCAYTFAARMGALQQNYENKITQYEEKIKHIEHLLDL